jgi:DNA mismatch endonuclease (patch repair protein)
MGKANQSRNTSPERLLRSALHRRGLRFRVHQRPEASVRTTADVLFRRARVAVFVDGCFWHCCPEHGNMPKSNRSWWEAKLQANVERDRRTDAALRERGWCVVRVWEHELPDDAAALVADLVRNSASVTTGS